MSEYVLVLQRAWQIIGRYKALWGLGLLAVICGQDAVFNLRGALRWQPWADVLVNLPLPASNLLRALGPDQTGPVAGLLTLGLGAILIALGAAATAALLRLTHAIERGDEVSLKSGWLAGLKYVRPLISLRLILNLPAIALALIALLLAGNADVTQTAQAAGWLPALLIAGLIAGVFAGAIGVGADRACVFEDAGVIEALRRGGALLRKNIQRYCVVTGIFIASALMIVFLLACPLAIGLTDTVAQIAQAAPPGADLTPWLLGTPIGVAAALLLVGLYALFTAFTSIVWTLIYRRCA